MLFPFICQEDQYHLFIISAWSWKFTLPYFSIFFFATSDVYHFIYLLSQPGVGNSFYHIFKYFSLQHVINTLI